MFQKVNKIIFFTIGIIFLNILTCNASHDTNQLKNRDDEVVETPLRPGCFFPEMFLDHQFQHLVRKKTNQGNMLQDETVIDISYEDLDELYPPSLLVSLQDVDESLFGGQICYAPAVNNYPLYSIGSGTLLKLEIKEENDQKKYRGYGITALHNIVKYKGNEKNPSIKLDLKFLQSLKLRSGQDKRTLKNEEIISLGEIEIKNVYVATGLEKDVCIFEGEYKFNSNIFSNQEFDQMWRLLQRFQPTFIHEELNLNNKGLPACIYHYPWDMKGQRVNHGVLKQDGLHTIGALSGSSGATIFCQGTNNIIGLHLGTSIENITENIIKIIKEGESEQEMNVASYNTYVTITMQDYDKIMNSNYEIYEMYYGKNTPREVKKKVNDLLGIIFKGYNFN